jgi:hypothetical protein
MEEPVATTAEVADALSIKVPAINQPRANKTRLERLGSSIVVPVQCIELFSE